MSFARDARVVGVCLLGGALAALVGCGILDDDGEGLIGLEPRAELNVIVVSFDALRPDALGVYGYGPATSPNIDEFARTSVVFDSAYSSAPTTPLAYAGMFTARYPNKVLREGLLLTSDTLAEAFSSAGYSTAAFLNNPWMGRERGFGHGFDTYSTYRHAVDEKVLEDAVDWLEDHAREPVLFWIHFLDPHAPYEWRESASHLYRDGYVGRFEREAQGPSTRAIAVDDPRDLARMRELYDGEVFHADELFGELLAHLERLELAPRSLVLLLSDHGEEFMEHGRLQHNRLYGEHLRVPLIVRHPDLREGTRVGHRVSTIDLFPTIARLAGLPPPREADGMDVSGEGDEDRWLAAVSYGGLRAAGSIWDGSDKLIVDCASSAVHLFDLQSDPEEQLDQAERRESDVRELETRLWSVLEEEPCPGLESVWPMRRALDPETRKALKALGYLIDD